MILFPWIGRGSRARPTRRPALKQVQVRPIAFQVLRRGEVSPVIRTLQARVKCVLNLIVRGNR